MIAAGLGAGLAMHGCAPPPRPAPEAVARIIHLGLGDETDRFRSIALELREPGRDDATTVVIDDSNQARVAWDSGITTVLSKSGDHSWRTGEPSRSATGDEVAAATRLREQCRAALLAPLVESVAPTRIDGTTIRLGDEWTLEHDRDRPVRLTSNSSGSVRFIELGEQPELQLPRKVEFSQLGVRTVRILGDQVAIEADAFTPPGAERPKPDFVISGEAMPKAPVFQTIRPCRWLVLPDPGNWGDRLDLIKRHGRRLGKAGQSNSGDPILFADGDGAKLAIPFRANRDADDYVAGPDEDVREATEATAAVVYCKPGAFDSRVRTGAESLETLLRQNGREASGPLRTIVEIYYLQQLADDPAVAETMDLRLELPIES